MDGSPPGPAVPGVNLLDLPPSNSLLKPLQFQPFYPLGVSAGNTFFSCSLVHAITEVLV